MDKQQALKEYFGYDSFRPGQEKLIDAILAGRDVLGVMPTGAGKSLCFQIPALLLEGTTIVISPLISLMKDQVGALRENGVPAAFINSTLSSYDYFDTLDGFCAGYYKLLYVAPERLDVDSFLNGVAHTAVPLVTVDEAHCVSQWGQDFRPGYLKIRAFIESLPHRPPVAAFTATATRQVSEDILRLLDLHTPEVISTGFDRKNLYFGVEQPKNKAAALKRFIQERAGRSGIIYCSTRKGVEEVCASLNAEGMLATRYHAGLTEEERKRNQDDFLYDRYPIMVATNAFGMGIDKSNVSYVVHYNMPKDLESYYQEAGRAGRDGSPAECVLYYSGRDVRTNQFLIDNSGEEADLDPGTLAEVRRKSRERLKRMTWYCHTDGCLRAYLLQYFGETPPPRCEYCSNCGRRYIEEDVTVEAQKILSCVKRAGERFGAKVIADILRGSESERMRIWNFSGLSTYGIMKEDSAARVRSIIDFLVYSGYLRVTDDKYPVLKLTPLASDVLFHGRRLTMKTPERAPEREKQIREKAAPDNPELFERLRRLRARIAAAESVPAYIVFPDATLREFSRLTPTTPKEMIEVSGVGRRKLERYGAAFLTEISLYLNEN